MDCNVVPAACQTERSARPVLAGKLSVKKAPKSRPVLKTEPLPLKSDWTDRFLVEPSFLSSESFLEIAIRIPEPRYSRHPRSCRRGFSPVLPLSSVCLRGQ